MPHEHKIYSALFRMELKICYCRMVCVRIKNVKKKTFIDFLASPQAKPKVFIPNLEFLFSESGW